MWSTLKLSSNSNNMEDMIMVHFYVSCPYYILLWSCQPQLQKAKQNLSIFYKNYKYALYQIIGIWHLDFSLILHYVY